MQAHHDAVMSESEDDDAGAFGGRRHAETQESPSLLPHKRRQEEIYSSDEEAQADEDAVGGKVRIVDDLEVDTDNWMMSIEDDEESRAILEVIKKEFDEQLDFWDTTMVAEYAGEIFEYMSELEVCFISAFPFYTFFPDFDFPHHRNRQCLTPVTWIIRLRLNGLSMHWRD